ncbi:MAG: outer membrane beta-barrel protein [Phycisphaera sp.]|nr:outer membrane beta-barrel protein [Phycisphaera sp.]
MPRGVRGDVTCSEDVSTYHRSPTVIRIAIAMAVAVTLGLSTTSFAADPISTIAEMVGASTQTADEGGANLFGAKQIDVNVIGGAFTGINNVETIYFGGVDVDWFFWDDLSCVTELVGYGVQQDEDRLGGDNDNSAGVGFNLLGRWHFLKRNDDKIKVFVEAGAGLAYFNDNTPGPEGTHFNFTPQGGVGVKWRFADNIGLIAGVRYLHISNANIHGSDRNPGIDSIGGYGGLTIDF